MMFGLFKTKPLLSQQHRQFQHTTWKWLLERFGGDDFFLRTYLVLPTKTFFPDPLDSNEDAAQKTFERVKQLANLSTWPCRLEKQQPDPQTKVAATLALQNAPSGPAGTFSIQGNNEVVISYNPGLVSHPVQMVATFAHELAHYLTASCEESPPGGWDNWELVTDIAATFMGFGIFQANSAFNFSQHSDIGSQGWQFNRSGYLSEAEHIYSLAIFLKLKNIASSEALPYLKPGLATLLKSAMKTVEVEGLLPE